jgi:fucose permease
MATRSETVTVYVAGTVQGIVLVTFPAAGTIFTDPTEYDLSNTQYGLLFVPQVITAIAASLLAGRLAGRVGMKRVYLWGLMAGLVSMCLLVASTLFTSEQSLAFGLLLLATACLGVGFGLTVPSLNTLTAAFHPGAAARSVLVLNALLGLGTALAPVFVAVFVGLGFWWGLPVLSAGLLIGLLVVSWRLPLRAGARRAAAAATAAAAIPARFWVFAGFAVLYGFCETINGNWAQLDMTTEVGTSTTTAAIALTTFWAMVTVGRVFFAIVERWFPATRTIHVLPFVLACVFLVIAVLPSDAPALGVLTFGLAGLGCSALLPLTISFGQGELVSISTAVAGGVIAFYQVGYGIAAFGIGPLLDSGVSLSTVYGWTAAVAAAMGGLAFIVTKGAAPTKV